MKKIFSLTNIFVKEFYQSLPVFDKEKRKFNKKSVFFWLIAIIFFGISYVSYEVIKFLVDIGQPEIFLNLYFLILTILLMFQTILVCANIFFFSKDIENVLYMPIKPAQLLVAKLNTLLCMLYATEAVFTLVPLTLYGLLTGANLLYYFWGIITLAVFPIFIALVISIIMLIIMRFAKFIKNKDIFQVVITIILTTIICVAELKMSQELFNVDTNQQITGQSININEIMQEINSTLLIINPTVSMLSNPSSLQAIISFFTIIVYNIITMLIFIAVGNKTYLKDILKNMISTNGIIKKKRPVDIKEKSKSKGVARAYISKEIKGLIKQPIFFMQCVFPVLIILITCIILVVAILPIILEAVQDEQFNNALNNLTFNTEIVCDILIVLQVMFSISNISLTAFSRDGEHAVFVKYIPVELYKQFIYKSIPQFLLNLLITVAVLGLIWYLVPTINLLYLFIIFAIATFINLINSYLMLIVDLRRPNLDWNSEYAVVKKSDNKLFQYALMIVNVLLLLYIATIFKEIDILIALSVELAIFAVVFIVIDRCVKKWQTKLFNKII